uniref:Uncharacterized protein n=1 Tax=viral metagenome TaxID=1070528 RepID=A0A6C0EBW5_9ZZZZ
MNTIKMPVFIGYSIGKNDLLKVFDLRKDPIRTNYIKHVFDKFSEVAQYKNLKFTHVKEYNIFRVEKTAATVPNVVMGMYTMHKVSAFRDLDFLFGCKVDEDKKLLEFDCNNFYKISDDAYEEFIRTTIICGVDYISIIKNMSLGINIIKNDTGLMVGLYCTANNVDTEQFITHIKNMKDVVKKQLSKIKVHIGECSSLNKVENPEPKVIIT